MRKLSIKAKAALYPAMAKQKDLLDVALHDVLNNRVTWSGWIREVRPAPDRPAGWYRAGLCRMDTCPILLLAFRVKGQRDSITVNPLDDHLKHLQRLREGSDLYQAELDAVGAALARCSAPWRGAWAWTPEVAQWTATTEKTESTQPYKVRTARQAVATEVARG